MKITLRKFCHGSATRALLIAALVLPAACSKSTSTLPVPTLEVSALTVTKRDTPIDFEFTAQTQSSREVEIRARIDGFLDKRVYTEGTPVRAGDTLFVMDQKPLEAALQTAKGELAQQQARLTVASANLARVEPLAAQNALSKRNLDDAVGSEQQARAAVLSAQGQVQTAQLNLSYATIKSPVTGLSSYARQQEGSYISAASNLLTYVYQLNPMWVNFSVSENQILGYREQSKKGLLQFPKDNNFSVTVILADGTVYPTVGRIDFTNPAFSPETGTFLVRAALDNPQGTLRPGQFVRARLSGAIRPDVILVPQRAVLQGAKSHFVWVIDRDSKARQRVVEVGEWQGDDWFITGGLQSGERIVVDGAIRVAPDMPLKIAAAPVATDSHAAAAATASGAKQ